MGKINRELRERIFIKKSAKLRNERKMVEKDGPEDGERVIGRMPSWTTEVCPRCVDSQVWPITKRAISNGRT